MQLVPRMNVTRGQHYRKPYALNTMCGNLPCRLFGEQWPRPKGQKAETSSKSSNVPFAFVQPKRKTALRRLPRKPARHRLTPSIQVVPTHEESRLHIWGTVLVVPAIRRKKGWPSQISLLAKIRGSCASSSNIEYVRSEAFRFPPIKPSL